MSDFDAPPPFTPAAGPPLGPSVDSTPTPPVEPGLRALALVSVGLHLIPLMAIWGLLLYLGADAWGSWQEPCPPDELCNEGQGIYLFVVFLALIPTMAVGVPLLMQAIGALKRRLGLLRSGAVLVLAVDVLAAFLLRGAAAEMARGGLTNLLPVLIGVVYGVVQGSVVVRALQAGR